jgi:spore germination cell wall hydrolase CwlJ-like protein
MRCTVLAAAFASVFGAANASEVAANVVLEALNSEKKALAEVLASGGVDLLAVAGRATPRDVATSNMGHLEEEDALTANVLDKSGLSETAHILRASGANAWSEFKKAKADGGAQWRCLAEALYFEARGEGLSGQVAVAEVILNRVKSRGFPSSVCDVVTQGSGKKNACQFSYTCDGKPEHVLNENAFKRAGKIARVMIDGRPRVLTGDAVFYHNTSVRPKWTRKLVRTAVIGEHVFYRKPVRLSQR